jgi:hypothetical protein
LLKSMSWELPVGLCTACVMVLHTCIESFACAMVWHTFFEPFFFFFTVPSDRAVSALASSIVHSIETGFHV